MGGKQELQSRECITVVLVYSRRGLLHNCRIRIYCTFNIPTRLSCSCGRSELLSGLFHAVCTVYTVHSVLQGGTCCVGNQAM